MTDTDKKIYTFDDALMLLHDGLWWEFTDWNNRIYSNLRLMPKIYIDEVLVDNPYTLPTEEELNAQVSQLQTEYDAQDYARKRKAEYPTIEGLVVALYDTDDKAAIEDKRAEVKAKYPKRVTFVNVEY